MTPSSHELEPPTNPEPFTTIDCADIVHAEDEDPLLLACVKGGFASDKILQLQGKRVSRHGYPTREGGTGAILLA